MLSRWEGKQLYSCYPACDPLSLTEWMVPDSLRLILCVLNVFLIFFLLPRWMSRTLSIALVSASFCCHGKRDALPHRGWNRLGLRKTEERTPEYPPGSSTNRILTSTFRCSDFTVNTLRVCSIMARKVAFLSCHKEWTSCDVILSFYPSLSLSLSIYPSISMSLTSFYILLLAMIQTTNQGSSVFLSSVSLRSVVHGSWGRSYSNHRSYTNHRKPLLNALATNFACKTSEGNTYLNGYWLNNRQVNSMRNKNIFLCLATLISNGSSP